MARVPNTVSLEATIGPTIHGVSSASEDDQRAFLLELDRQVAEIERKRAEEQSKPEPSKDDDSPA